MDPKNQSPWPQGAPAGLQYLIGMRQMVEHLKAANDIEKVLGIQTLAKTVVANVSPHATGSLLDRIPAGLYSMDLAESEIESAFEKESRAASDFKQSVASRRQSQAIAQIRRVSVACIGRFLAVRHAAGGIQPSQFVIGQHWIGPQRTAVAAADHPVVNAIRHTPRGKSLASERAGG